ncbi:MAG: hypothetical protein PWP52_1642 [Bacteroidales bacterium]|nr:hypothetical protein [Bacteroidales bacterium]
MVFEQIDRNTYIQRPIYEFKEAKKPKTKELKILTNNEENQTLVSIGAPIVNQPTGYWQLIDYVKKTPELISPIEALVTDSVSGFDFELVNPNDSQRKIEHAHQFCLRNNLLQQLRNAQRDRYIYGNGYLVISKIDDSEIKEVINNSVYEMKSLDYEFKEFREFVDELSYKNATITYLPATTVSIFVEDKFGHSIKYKQVVGTNSITFNDKDVIHFRDIEYDGKLFGYSRIYSLKSEIQMLWFAKDYLGRYFDNNATPNLLFISPNLKPNSPQYMDFVKQLEDLKKQENKQRNLLSTSEVKIERLNDLNTNMQFKELLDYVTSLIAMTYQVPPTRVGVAGSANGEAVTLTNQGYYRNISSTQDYLEEILNTQLFIPLLGVKGKLKRDYKEDMQREAAINKSKLDAIEQMIRTNMITREAGAKLAMSFMGFSEQDIPTEEALVEKSNQYLQNQKSETDLLDAPQQHERTNKTPKKFK